MSKNPFTLVNDARINEIPTRNNLGTFENSLV
jgi:hypothetical protein